MATTTAAPRTAPGRAPRIAFAVLGAAMVNVVLYYAFGAAGAVYETSTLPAPVALSNVLIMTIVPLGLGLVVAALLARKWPALLKVARWAGVALALVTIAMTAAAGFGTLALVSLALMHVVVAAAVLVGLGTTER